MAQAALDHAGHIDAAAWAYAMREASRGFPHSSADGPGHSVPWTVLPATLTPEEEALVGTVCIAGVSWAKPDKDGTPSLPDGTPFLAGVELLSHPPKHRRRRRSDESLELL